MMATGDQRKDKSPVVWLIDEGHAGHRSQSRGLAEAIERQAEAKAHELLLDYRVPGWLRPALRRYLAVSPTPHERIFRACYRLPALPRSPPDLLISSGGRTVLAANYLRRHFGCRHVYLGPPEPFAPACFDLILSPVEHRGYRSVLKTDFLLTTVSPDGIAGEGAHLRRVADTSERGRLGAVLIGGRSRSSVFEDKDWQQLAWGLNSLHHTAGWKWLITTSRRTGRQAEDLLRRLIVPEALLDATWWNEEQRKVLGAYLDASDVVLVTRDSLTMISEAVASGKPTVVVEPAERRPSSYLDSVLGEHCETGRILCVACSGLPAAEVAISTLSPVSTRAADDYARVLLGMISPTPASRAGDR
jgi:mitochondrial fission protein ELM1